MPLTHDFGQNMYLCSMRLDRLTSYLGRNDHHTQYSSNFYSAMTGQHRTVWRRTSYKQRVFFLSLDTVIFSLISIYQLFSSKRFPSRRYYWRKLKNSVPPLTDGILELCLFLDPVPQISLSVRLSLQLIALKCMHKMKKYLFWRYYNV